MYKTYILFEKALSLQRNQERKFNGYQEKRLL